VPKQLTTLSTEILFAATTVNWVSTATLHEPSDPRQGLTGSVSLSGKKSYIVFCLPKAEIVKDVFNLMNYVTNMIM